MPGFHKPQSLKAALKLGLYGPAGSGKTFTALLIAEGLARQSGKRVAFCDTEFGTAFYSRHVPQRPHHPEAFDFDVLYTRSITEVLDAVKGLSLETHGVLVVDSITHLWESCKNAFTGRLTRAGTVPLHAWSAIKKLYRDLMNALLTLPLHVLICGRMGIDYVEDEASGELKSLGYKMRAEGETAYEPDVLLRMEFHKANREDAAVPVAHAEKDRTGVLSGRTILWPAFENIAQPLLGLLGTAHMSVPTDEQVSLQDAEALARQEAERARHSAELSASYAARMAQAADVATLQWVGQEVTPELKGRLTRADLARVRRAYQGRLDQLRAAERVTAEVGESAGPSELGPPSVA
jgi:hypothetical protein